MSPSTAFRRSASVVATAALALGGLFSLGAGQALAVPAGAHTLTAAQRSESAQTFSITVESVDVLGGLRSFTIDGLTADTLVAHLRQTVAGKLQANPQDVVLIHRLQELQDARTLGYYKIESGSEVTAEAL
ncbi:ubiquitin-like domain-containing protein [Kitasatospora sp. NPDC089509]|uniref:ubiquitin-like domain-containing protein n=1 Tax=Kitasatospora sp. NPDC089509 TaxID=3364079 RepID=UPI0037F913BF